MTASSNRRTSRSATARLPSAWPSARRSSMSRYIYGRLRDGDGVVEPAHLPQREPQVGQRPAFAVPVTELAADLRPAGGGDRLVKPAHLPQHESEVSQRLALAVPVTELPVDLPSRLRNSDGVVEPAELLLREPEVGQRLAFAVPVTELMEDLNGLLAGGDRLPNRRTSRSADPRLSRATPSPWRSPSWRAARIARVVRATQSFRYRRQEKNDAIARGRSRAIAV